MKAKWRDGCDFNRCKKFSLLVCLINKKRRKMDDDDLEEMRALRGKIYCSQCFHHCKCYTHLGMKNVPHEFHSEGFDISILGTSKYKTSTAFQRTLHQPSESVTFQGKGSCSNDNLYAF